MARGHIGGSRQLQFDPSAFLQGWGGDKNIAMEMAMQMMGYGQGTSPEQLGLSRERLLAEIAGQTGTQDIERQKLEEQRRANVSAEDYRKWEKQQAADALKREMEFRTADVRQKQQQAEMDLVKEYIRSHPDLKPEQIEPMISGFSPTAQKTFTGMADQAQAAMALTLLPQIQAAYKTGHPEEILKGMFEKPNLAAALKRPEIPWQQLNEALGAQQAKSGSQLFQGALSKPWQEYQGAPDLEQVFVPPPAPKGTEGIAPWLRPEAPALGAMDWRYGAGGPSVDPAQYSQYAPGAAFSRQGLPNLPPDVPGTQEPGMLDRILATLGLK